MSAWTIERTLQANPIAARLDRAGRRDYVLLALAHDRLGEERGDLLEWCKNPASSTSDPLYHDLESFFAKIIDGLIDCGADGLSHRFGELAEATHESLGRARRDPHAAATPDYRDDAPTALHEYEARLDELRWWCSRRMDAIRKSENDRNAEWGQAVEPIAPDSSRPSLAGSAKDAAAFIDANPGAQGPEIAHEIGKEPATFYKHIVPKLRKAGYHCPGKNDRATGYHPPQNLV